ncbi:TetR/AcrR family transcriptional regulator [Actinoallomurus rhizosphaericola]|uniref:TetR/AcrR family transcriptional regulator n=1 Tax=Actinoallomurus rhizosphaericola TaxID=2952536 RepID=UPI00209391F7|nr:TetR family transcriptional regulator C-terminal domain-containing protein [Actinoallomurus rhizosphaericola]MCO5999820.1 TetR family transcriptional regulator C-terminal domain-containing protein [Actinoallomurus rhizosphaericola]
MPRKVDHGERRRQIAEALLRIAGTQGLAAATMRHVAAEAGVSVPLVQYYFNSKDELLLQALPYLGEQLWNRVRGRLDPLDTTTVEPREVLETTLCAVLPTDQQSRQIMLAYNAYYALAITQPNEATRHALTHPNAMERFLADQIRRAQQRSVISAHDDPRRIAAGLLALTNGLALGILGGQHDSQAAQAILTYYLDRLFIRSR